MESAKRFTVSWWQLDRITPYEGNPRRITKAAIAKVQASIEAFGWRQPIVVDGAGVIVVGHVRLLAAQALGLAKAPVHVWADADPEMVRAYRLADNRAGEESSWDEALLALELEGIAELDLTAFDALELEAYTGAPEFEPVDETGQPRLDKRTPLQCPSCGHAFTVSAKHVSPRASNVE